MPASYWLVATCVLLSSCKSSAYEAYCYSSSYQSEDGASTVSYPCYASQAKCQKRLAAKSKAQAESSATIELGACEKTSTIHCAEPEAKDGLRVCGPSRAACEEVAAQASGAGNATRECQSMSGEALERMRKDEQARRRSKASEAP